MPDYNLRYAGSGTMMGGTKPSKAAAHYTPAGGRERCGQCRHFVPASACNRIVGPVSAMGWCSYFSREMAVLLQPGATYGGGTDPNAPAIDLSLMGPTLDPSITFTRTSANATYFDVAGTMQTAAANTPRFDYDPVTHVMRGLLLEEQRINILLNSAALGTQSVAVTAQLYTLSFYGTGTITKSGTASGALVGTGAFPQRVTQSFTPTAGTLTLTVTGTVTNAQLEAGQNATSYVLTAGATATRTAESAVITSAPWITPAASTLAAEYLVTYSGLIAASAFAIVEIDDGTLNNMISFRNTNPANVASITFVANASVGGNTLGAFTPNAVTKAALAVNGTTFACATSLNGSAAASFSLTNSPAILTRFVIGSGRGVPVDAWMRRVRYWPRVLSNAELQAATT